MPTVARKVVIALTVALPLLGCSDNPTRPSRIDPLDVAGLLAAMSPRGSIAGSSWLVPSALPTYMVAPVMDPARCTFSSVSNVFVCPDAADDGNQMRFTRTYRLIDAAGNSQPKVDANTSAIETRTTLTGVDSVVGAVGPGVISTTHLAGMSDMTLSGIHNDQRMLNGVVTTAFEFRNDFGDTVHVLRGTITETANLVLPNPSAGRIWPSGTFTIAQPPGMDLNNTTLTQTTFDGNGHVTLTITDASGTRTCRMTMLIGGGISDGGCTYSNP